MIGQCDVFVHPSIYKAESLPTVIIEALFAGVPVIATDVGEVATMIGTPRRGNWPEPWSAPTKPR